MNKLTTGKPVLNLIDTETGAPIDLSVCIGVKVTARNTHGESRTIKAEIHDAANGLICLPEGFSAAHDEIRISFIYEDTENANA